MRSKVDRISKADLIMEIPLDVDSKTSIDMSDTSTADVLMVSPSDVVLG